MIAVPSVSPCLEGGLTPLHNIDAGLLSLKEELRLSSETKGIVRLLVSVSGVLVINRDVSLMDDLAGIDGMTRLVIDVPTKNAKERVEELNPERRFAISWLDVLCAVCRIPSHKGDKIVTSCFEIVLHACRLLLNRCQSAGRTLRICAVATRASSSSRSSFDVGAIIRAGEDTNREEKAEGTGCPFLLRRNYRSDQRAS